MKSMKMVGIAILFASAVLEALLFTAVVHAEDILNLKLRQTHIRTNFALQTASCTVPSCRAIQPVFDPPELIVPCTGGRTCTYKLTLCGSFLFSGFLIDAALNEGDNVFFRFLIDGTPPLPAFPVGTRPILSPVPQGGG
jgi:hypothetical protein